LRIVLLGEDGVRVEQSVGPLTVEAARPDEVYSPFHMMGSGLAVCTLSVLQSWAAAAKLDSRRLAIQVHWSFVEQPHRIGAYDVRLEWPDLDPKRHPAAERVAAMCAVKATLADPPEIRLTLAP
jgi:uncharacterized OsmC-like protein